MSRTILAASLALATLALAAPEAEAQIGFNFANANGTSFSVSLGGGGRRGGFRPVQPSVVVPSNNQLVGYHPGTWSPAGSGWQPVGHIQPVSHVTPVSRVHRTASGGVHFVGMPTPGGMNPSRTVVSRTGKSSIDTMGRTTRVETTTYANGTQTTTTTMQRPTTFTSYGFGGVAP